MSFFVIAGNRYAPASSLAPAIAALKERGVSRVLNDYDFGGYLIWALPDRPTFIDGRTDLFPTTLFSDYVTIEAGGPAALDALTRHDVNTAIVRAGSPAAETLAAAPDWRAVASDDVATVYTRR